MEEAASVNGVSVVGGRGAEVDAVDSVDVVDPHGLGRWVHSRHSVYFVHCVHFRRCADPH
jgi:hypothetical protein